LTLKLLQKTQKIKFTAEYCSDLDWDDDEYCSVGCKEKRIKMQEQTDKKAYELWEYPI